MSIENVRPYFRTHMNALGFKEWTDAFNIENIPSNVIEKTYHLRLGTATAQQHNMTSLEVNQPMTVTVFRKGYRTPADAVDTLALDSVSIINLVLKPSNRIPGNLHNVKLGSIFIEEIAPSNDNLAMLTLEFECLVILNPN